MAKSKFRKKLDKINYEPIIHILIIIIVVLFILNLMFITSLSSSLKQKIAEVKEAARPAKLEITLITAPCTNCFNISKVIETIKSGNVNITKEVTITETQAENFLRNNLENLSVNLITKYNINKLPTVIVQGEINRTNLNATLSQVGDALVFTSQNPPYYDVESNKVKGLVSATIINAENCTACINVSPLLNQLESNGVVISKAITLTEVQAKDLIDKYNINILPSLILSSDAGEYALFKQNWPSLGTEESDGNFVLRNLLPPYKNLTTGSTEGLVMLTYVVDSSCKDCYNVTLHKRIIESYGIKIINETTFDVSTQEGISFSRDNNITLVPTIVLSKEAKAYPGFYKVFTQVSKEGQNGNLVFTAVDQMGKHKNIETGEIIEPQQR